MRAALCRKATLRVARTVSPRRIASVGPLSIAAQHVTVPTRTFVSLSDLAKLTPFGSTTKPGQAQLSNDPSARPQGGEQYTESVTLPFPRQHLFRIISDVAAYQDFVPYCVSSRVLADGEGPAQQLIPANDASIGQRQFLATLTVGFGSLREEYTSRVTLLDGAKVIAEAIPTPLFQHLRTEWSLSSQTASTTRVDFYIHYAFANPIYAAMAKASMHKMASQMIGAFEQRAAEVAQS